MAHSKDLSLKDINLSKDDLVLISPNDPKAMSKYAAECRDLKVPYLYDPGQQVVRNDPEDIKEGIIHAQSLFINEYEKK